MLAGIDRRDFLNVFAGFLGAYGAIAFLCFFYLVQRWENSAPTSPDPTRGLIYYHNEHGSITYFSAFQTTSCALLLVTSIPLALVGVLVSPKCNALHRRRFFSGSFRWEPDDPKRLQRVGSIVGTVAAPILVFVVGPAVVNALIAAGAVFPFG